MVGLPSLSHFSALMIEPANISTENSSAQLPSQKGNIARRLRSYWWIPVSYCIPYMIVHSIVLQSGTVSDANNEITSLRSHYSGLLGLAMATVIFALWRLDCAFGARQILRLCRDKQAKVLVHVLGMALWVCWVGIGVAACMAYDQVHEQPTTLPGLRAPI